MWSAPVDLSLCCLTTGAEPVVVVGHTGQLVFRQHQIAIRTRFEEHKTVPSFKVARDLLQAGQVGGCPCCDIGSTAAGTGAACDSPTDVFSATTTYITIGV